MGFIPKRIDLPDPKLDQHFAEQLVRALDSYTLRVGDVVNGGQRIEENNDCQVKSVTTAGAGVELTVTHTLKRVPTGFFVINLDKAAIIYDSGTSWTTSNIYIKSNEATTTAKLLIF